VADVQQTTEFVSGTLTT